ncbi:unnamed protein product, partial [Closterium sp. Yama58-4]
MIRKFTMYNLSRPNSFWRIERAWYRVRKFVLATTLARAHETLCVTGNSLRLFLFSWYSLSPKPQRRPFARQDHSRDPAHHVPFSPSAPLGALASPHTRLSTHLPLLALISPRHHLSAPSSLRALISPRPHLSAPSSLRALISPRPHLSAPSSLRALISPHPRLSRSPVPSCLPFPPTPFLPPPLLNTFPPFLPRSCSTFSSFPSTAHLALPPPPCPRQHSLPSVPHNSSLPYRSVGPPHAFLLPRFSDAFSPHHSLSAPLHLPIPRCLFFPPCLPFVLPFPPPPPAAPPPYPPLLSPAVLPSPVRVMVPSAAAPL